MTRIKVLTALVTIGILSMSVAAYQAPAGGGQAAQQQQRNVEVDKVKDNLFILRGGGGNTAVFIATDGVIVVDTKNPGWGQPILEKIKGLTTKPIIRIINTHTHGDHVSGNVEFPPTVEVVTHENTKKNMELMRPVTGIAQQGPPTNIFKENKGVGMPRRTFKDQMSIGRDNDRIDLYYFGRGHTDGDAWVVFRALRVAHAGDIFSGKNLPLLDANNGGTGVLIGDTLAKAADSLAKNVDTVITGHAATTMTVNDLREYAQFNKDFLATVREAKKAGRSVEDLAKSWKMPEKYVGYAAPQAARLQANIQVIFDELSK